VLEPYEGKLSGTILRGESGRKPRDLPNTNKRDSSYVRDVRYSNYMSKYKFTEYFENEVLRKRPYLKKEWCTAILDNPIQSESQEGNRFRFWGQIDELEGKYLRVITLEDKITIHNAFPDRRFKE
jgi:hypothetical protein